MSEPTIFEGLRVKLGRAPSRFELQQEVRRGFVTWGPKSKSEVR